MCENSLTVKLGGNWISTAPSLFAVLRGDILSRNSSNEVMAPFSTFSLLS